MPLRDGLLCIRVEVLLLLVEERLCLDGVRLLGLEFLDGLGLLGVSLGLDEGGQLSRPLLFFFFLLLLGQLELLVADSPEFSEVFLFLLLGNVFGPLALDLEGSALVDGLFHISLSLLLLLEESVSLVFSLRNLFVQDLLLVVLERSEFLDLTVNHALSLSLLGLEALIFTLFLHLVAGISRLGKLLDLLFLLSFLEEGSLLLFELILVCLGEVSSNLSALLLSGDFLLLFSLEVLLDLSLDKLAFQELLLDLLDVVELELLELVTDVLGVLLSEVVLLLELLLHLFIVLLHLLLLDLLPVLFNFLLHVLLPVSEGLLRLLLVGDVAHEHLRLQGLNHVLGLLHVSVGLLDSLAAEVVLVLLLDRVNPSAFDLIKFKWVNMMLVVNLRMTFEQQFQIYANKHR